MDENTEAFFSIVNKKLTSSLIFQGARRSNKHSSSTSENGSVDEHKFHQQTNKGTDYATPYIKEEEMNLFLHKISTNRGDSRMEEVSIATDVTQRLEDVEDIMKIYKTYAFDCPPRTHLTINNVRHEILNRIQSDQVFIIHGPTGCGKTTQVPQFILQNCIEKKLRCNIVVTQPRRIAAISIAKRVCEEREWPVGSVVGYKVGLSNCTSKDTLLTYCTTGVLLHKLINTRNMNEYTHIIIDEVHERDQDLDFLLLVIRKFLRTNSPSVRLILMSATIDTSKFANYFSSSVGDRLAPAPLIHLQKDTYYSVKEFYLDNLTSLTSPKVSLDEPILTTEMLKLSAELLKRINKLDKRSICSEDTEVRPTVLMFLPGIYEIEELYGLLMDPSHDKYKWDVLCLHSLLTKEEQEKIFKEPEPAYRRIILSTNIAESSITVPNVKYIIDFCLTKQLVKNHTTNYQSLELTWASKASCQQRAGRTGRVMDGRVYRLITKEMYKGLPDEAVPEILQTPLEIAVLRSKMLNMGEPKAILALAIDPPRLDHLEQSIILLKEIGGLVNTTESFDQFFDGQITDLGRVMALLPIDVQLSKMIMLGNVFSVLRDIIIIAASMSVKNMFTSPLHNKLNGYKAKLSWSKNLNSDGIAFLNAYKQWKIDKAAGHIRSNTSEKLWGQRNFLEIRVLREIDALVREITNRLMNVGIGEVDEKKRIKWDVGEKELVIKTVMAGAFYPNYFLTDIKYKNDNLGKREFDPLKTVYLTGWPVDQPGLFYIDKIKEQFQTCLTSKYEIINVDFDSSRVLITFDYDKTHTNVHRNQNNQISLSVFKALKMKQIKEKITIPLLNISSLYDQKSRTILTNVKNSSSLYSNYLLKQLRPILPEFKKNSRIKITIKYIKNPGNFWVYIDNESNRYNLKMINQYFDKLNPTTLEQFNESALVGTLLLAKQKINGKEVLARAVIQNVVIKETTQYVEVFFIDYGNTMQIHYKELILLPLNNTIDKIPALAVECKLAQIKPVSKKNLATDDTSSISTVDDGEEEEWSEEAINVFNNSFKNATNLHAEVYSISGAIMNIYLLLELNEMMSINEYLIQYRYAELREEDKLSAKNHSYREKFDDLSLNEIAYIEEMQYFSLDLDTKLIPGLEFVKMLTLKGPFSLLEVDINCLAHAGVGKKVTIAEESVNSVTLEPNVDHFQPRLIIAGSVNESSLSKNLSIRNTTVMPNIFGLSSLIAMIFAPRIELRCNSRKTQLTGVICGLGYNKTTRQSLFPDHDISIYFDYEITTEDLIDINKLRHWVSCGIYISNPNEPNDDIIKSQHKVKDCFSTIIYKKREKINVEIDSDHHQWGRYHDNMYLTHDIIEIKTNIYKLHDALDLSAKNDAKEVLMDNIAELKEIATMSFRTELKDIECKLCELKIQDVLQLRTHISSHNHRAKIFELLR